MYGDVLMQEPERESGTESEQAHVERSTRLLRLPEVMARVGLKRSTIYKRVSEGNFPKPRNIGPRSVAWSEAEIDRWIDEVLA